MMMLIKRVDIFFYWKLKFLLLLKATWKVKSQEKQNWPATTKNVYKQKRITPNQQSKPTKKKWIFTPSVPHICVYWLL